jgi:high-affinity iron transporter
VSPAPYRIAVAPRRAPDLAQAAALYTTHCGVCHGTAGRGDGPAARGMDPPPSNFTDRGRMDQRSVYGLFSTIGFSPRASRHIATVAAPTRK